MQGGGDEKEPRRVRLEALVGEVAVGLEIAESGVGIEVSEMVVADTDPVVEALEREVEVFFGFEFDERQLAGKGNGEEVEHAAIGVGAATREGGDLGVDGGRGELRIECGKILAKEALEPTLGLQAEEGIAPVGDRTGRDGAAGEEMVDERAECRLVVRGERGFVRPGANGDLELAVEGLAGVALADAGELQAMEEKGEVRGGAEAELAGWGGGLEAGFGVSGPG